MTSKSCKQEDFFLGLPNFVVVVSPFPPSNPEKCWFQKVENRSRLVKVPTFSSLST